MEEDYVLVSKDKVSKLENEIKDLKKQLKDKENEKPQSSQVDLQELIQKIVEVLHNESQKERDLIIQNLNEIKELNKSTLDNLLTKTQKLDGQLEEMVDTISGLVDTLSTVTNKFSNSNNFDELIKKIKEANEGNNLQIDQKVLSKLDEIDVFMKNLRILLSYVKPNDFKK